MKQPNARRQRGLHALIVVALAIGLGGYARYRIHARPEQGTSHLKEVLLLPPGEVLRQMDLGYHSLAASLLFLRANIYYGKHVSRDEELHWLNDFIKTILILDPDFGKIYLWGANTITYYQRKVDHVPPWRVKLANELLFRGMERFPQDPSFPARIGFNFYYELGDGESAIPFYERAASLPGVAPEIRQSLLSISSKQGRDQVAREVLKSLIAESNDPMVTKAMRQRLESLMGEQERQEFLTAHQRLTRAWQREYPFVPLDLFVLIADPETLAQGEPHVQQGPHDPQVQ